jgi:ABC-type transporter Mla subunit MlaD
MSANYENIRRQRGAIESFFGNLPGYKGYKEKEMRREADRLLREALVRDYTIQLDRITAVQNRVLEALGVEWMSALGALKTALQTLIDRIRHAPQGYAGFFDAVRVKEEQLDQLEAFDQQLVGELEKIKTALDALERAAGDPVALQTALAQANQAVRATADLFAQRNKVITGI